jgi:[ribosomal protein S18]-alanine N-acetyltransferase
MKQSDLLIRPLDGGAEVRFCAEFIVASEPWLTLGLTFDGAIERLSAINREIHVATINKQIVGVLILFLDGTFKGYIQLLAVHPNWRSRGIGTHLIAFAEERIFKISPNVFLLTSSFNLGAQRLYERLGFEHVGELKDFVVKGHSEFLMRKTRGPLRDFKPS